MEQKNLYELITSLADAEITDQSQIKGIRDTIEKNSDAKFDYNVQFLTKSVVSLRFKITPTPKHIRNKVIKKLK